MADIDALKRSFEIGQHGLREVSRETSKADGFIVEHVVFETHVGEAVRGLVTRPPDAVRAPAILYLHAHGGRYGIGADELLDGRPALQSPLGPALAAMGFVTLAIDMPCFGERTTISESTLSKALLWQGKSLAGQMIAEQAAALDWLAAREDVDARRIGAFGISMGATFGYWLAAVDPRIACVAHLCCYADFGALIETGAHDLHGIYLTVPGLLGQASNGEIAGLVAPRPQLICIGDQDPLTPPAAVDVALAQTRAAYAAAGASDRLSLHREPETGHCESPAMRAAVLAFFADQFAAG